MTSKKNRLVTAAIDLGTDYSGYAFVFNHEDYSKINANTAWAGGSLMSLKCPTCVLFEPNGTFHSFGFEAEDKYSDLAVNGEHRKWYYFHHFKTILQNKEIKRDMKIQDDKRLTMPARKVFGCAIRFLKTHLMNTLTSRGLGVSDKEIHWVLTAPAIWSDAAKQFLREAAVKYRKMTSKDNKLLVAAIDFGTTYSGYAFSFMSEELTKINAPNMSLGGNAMSLKCPTCVLFDPDENFHSFGYEAENKYSDLALDENHQKWYYFERFKMTLNNKQIKRDVEITDDKGLTMPAKRVFGAAIKFLKLHLLDYVTKLGQCVTENDVHWVLTVPAIWSDAAKQFMRETAASEANIDSGSLTIALEPEAASLYCQLLPSDKFSGSGRLTADKYMILDLGGGTADITVHEKHPDGSIRELHEPTGGACGGTKVDEAFHQILIKIVGAKIFKQFCDKNKADHVQLLRDLEIKKRAITPELDQKITVQIPVSLASTYQEECGETIEEALQGTPFKGQISWMSGRVRFNASLFRSLFEGCTSGLTQCVSELLQKPALKNVDTFLMVGGFSESPMIQAAIKKAFPDAKIIIPADAGLVVLKGAVVYGREPMKISSRIAKYTYGICISPAFNTTIHPQQKLVIVGGKERCRDVFKKYIQKGESITIGEKRSGTHVSLKPDQKEMLLKIYGSAAKDPQFITDPGCEYMGKLVVNLPEKHDIFKVKVNMMFGQTEILVEAEEETSKQKITSYFDFL